MINRGNGITIWQQEHVSRIKAFSVLYMVITSWNIIWYKFWSKPLPQPELHISSIKCKGLASFDALLVFWQYSAIMCTHTECGESFKWGRLPIKTLYFFPSPCLHCTLSFGANNCYSDVALSNFHDQECGSRNHPLASLTLFSFLPIIELAINIYEGIWIIWIEMKNIILRRKEK